MLAPPIPRKFDEKESIIAYLQEHARGEGYAVSIRRSSKGTQVELQCDRSGVYDGRNKRTGESSRATRSKKSGCPFPIYASKKKNGLWSFIVRHSTHNHDATDDLSAHFAHRRLTPEALVEVERLTATGAPPRQISAALSHSEPSALYKNCDIYNAKKKIRRAKLADSDRSP